MTSEQAMLGREVPMHVVVGRDLTGPTLALVDEVGGLGRPVWNPMRLLADLELRLGLAGEEVSSIVRVQAMSTRMAALRAVFFRRSYERDPVGTAAEVLDWRDELVLAGWDGERIADGGRRLDDLAELEAMKEPVVPPGRADRVRSVERELGRIRLPLHTSIMLADEARLWPARWRRIFALLACAGTRIESARRPAMAAAVDSDVGRLAARLAGGSAPSVTISGDGSFLVLRADNSLEAASAVAALLGAWGTEDTALVRGGAATSLDGALGAHGLAPLGAVTSSARRPALELLPLAIELAFLPRDPYRMLDLCVLPVGPFQSMTRRALARAISSSPGIGGRAWERAKENLRASLLAAAIEGEGPHDDEHARALRTRRADEQLTRVAAWFEQPAHDPVEGAPRAALAEVGERVAGWARARLASGSEDPVLRAAYRQAQEFLAALAVEPRDRLHLVAARQLVSRVSAAVAVGQKDAQAGRLDVVDAPAGLLRSRGSVLWWHFVTPAGRPRLIPWRRGERDALAAAGVELQDRALLLSADAGNWRAPFLLARQRLVLVIPTWHFGERVEPHPLWSEIQATAGGSSALARVTVTARELLADPALLVPPAPVEELPPSPLPSPRVSWTVPAGLVGSAPTLSASSLQTLIGCPLRFVLGEVAGLRAGKAAAIPTTAVLAGTLGHRMVEELQREGRFGGAAKALAQRAGEIFDTLALTEAAPLVLVGASFERKQIRGQLIDAMVWLDRSLAERGVSISGVEVETEIVWNGRTLRGRIDVLGRRAADGREVVVDLKWGKSEYRTCLREGRAVQLATYAHMRRTASGQTEPVPAAYFSLSRGQLLHTADLAASGRRAEDGPNANETWRRVEETASAIEAEMAAGRIPVTGVSASLPLVETLGSDLLRAPVGSACKYCDHDPICGRRWERGS